MDYSLAEKKAVHEAFEAMLDDLDAADREPDRWTEDCLSHSLTAMACGMYRLAAVELKLAAAPSIQRSPGSVQSLNSMPQKFTKEHLRRGLTAIKSLPSEHD